MLSKCTQWPGSHPARVCCTHSLAGGGLDLGRKEEAGISGWGGQGGVFQGLA